MSTETSQDSRWWQALMPWFGLAAGMLLIISRRPDALLHPGFWAEDGTIYFADVYNLGVKFSILHPQAGYFETVPVLAAWAARLTGLRAAPFTMAAIAVVAQATPVGLLLSRRAQAVLPSLPGRLAIALAYLAVPYQLELDATAVNVQWYLAITAVIVLLLAPPARRTWRILDTALLLAAGLTGPFALVLAVIAWLQRWRRGAATVPSLTAALLTGCALLQLVAATIIAPHTHSVAVEGRPHPQTGASVALFGKLVGGRVLLGSFIGENRGLSAAGPVQWAALVVVVLLVLGLAYRRIRLEFWMLLAVGGFVLAGTLVDPSVPSPAWEVLSVVPANSQRYFFIPEFLVLVVPIWIAAEQFPVAARCLAGGLATLGLILAVGGHWSYPRLATTRYNAHVTAFDRLPAGESEAFPEQPAPWVMVLRRQ